MYYYPQQQFNNVPNNHSYYPHYCPVQNSNYADFRQLKAGTFITASIDGLFDYPRRIFIRDVFWDGSVQRARIIYASGDDVQGATVQANRIEISHYQLQQQQQTRY